MTLLCAGEAFEDLIFVGLERLPELGEEVKTDRFTATIGGGAVITAVQAARLGMKTTLISAVCNLLRITSGEIAGATGLSDAEAYAELAELVVAAIRR